MSKREINGVMSSTCLKFSVLCPFHRSPDAGGQCGCPRLHYSRATHLHAPTLLRPPSCHAAGAGSQRGGPRLEHLHVLEEPRMRGEEQAPPPPAVPPARLLHIRSHCQRRRQHPRCKPRAEQGAGGRPRLPPHGPNQRRAALLREDRSRHCQRSPRPRERPPLVSGGTG